MSTTRTNTDELLTHALHVISLATRRFPAQPIHIFNLWLAAEIVKRGSSPVDVPLERWLNTGIGRLCASMRADGQIAYAAKPRLGGLVGYNTIFESRMPAEIFMLHILGNLKPDGYDDTAARLVHRIYQNVATATTTDVQVGGAVLEHNQDFLAAGQSPLHTLLDSSNEVWLLPQLVLLWALRLYSSIDGKPIEGDRANLSRAINSHFGNYPIETYGKSVTPATLGLYETVTENSGHMAETCAPKPWDALACCLYKLGGKLNEAWLRNLAEDVSRYGIRTAPLYGANEDECRLANALAIMLILARKK